MALMCLAVASLQGIPQRLGAVPPITKCVQVWVGIAAKALLQPEVQLDAKGVKTISWL